MRAEENFLAGFLEGFAKAPDPFTNFLLVHAGVAEDQAGLRGLFEEELGDAVNIDALRSGAFDEGQFRDFFAGPEYDVRA